MFKKTIFLILLSLQCSASEPKFHFHECVQVKSGFYRGCKGIVDVYFEGGGEYKPSYNLELKCKGEELSKSFDEDNLKRCKK